MYTKDKFQRITLRLNEEQFDYIKGNAEILGVSPSELLRMMVNSTMAISRKATEKIKEVGGRENDKADIDNLV